MDAFARALIAGIESIASPGLVAVLVALAIGALILALRPSPAGRSVQERLDGYGEPEVDDLIDNERMSRGFAERVLWPALRSILRSVGRLLPGRATADTERMLVVAGRPGGSQRWISGGCDYCSPQWRAVQWWPWPGATRLRLRRSSGARWRPGWASSYP